MLTHAEAEDIRKSYREAKDKQKQIEIMQDLYLTTRQEIIEVLEETNDYCPKKAGRPPKSQVVLPKPEAKPEQSEKPKLVRKAYPLNRPGDAVVEAIKRELDRVSIDVNYYRQQLSQTEQTMGELADFLKSIREEV